MASVGNIVALGKRHYEKLLLAVALLGLVVAVVYLQSLKSSEQQKMEEYSRNVQRRKTKGVPSVDMTPLQQALAAATNPAPVDFGLPHNLFNPVKWQRKPDGTIIKIESGTEIGPAALRIVKVAPLQTIITLDRSAGTGLYMSVTQEASTNAALRRKFQSYVTTNSMHSTRLFTLKEIQGTPDSPQAVIEFASGDRLTVAPDKPYTNIEGYKADLFYPPENRNLPERRVGDVLSLAGEDYIIVAITPNETVVSARSNNRRTTIRNNAAPSP